VLSELTVKDLTENPAVPYEEDQVTRIILDDLDMAAYCEIKDGTIAQLREWLLDNGTTGDEMLAAGRGRSLYCGIDRKYV
jgi:ethanolamine ammonia-lyase large subunit